MNAESGTSTVLRYVRKPWAIPAGVVAVVAATAITVPLIADADSTLPERSAGELLAGLAQAREVPFAGTVVYSADLGLPDLPAFGEDGVSPMSLLSGATTARVWYSDAETYRVALHGELSELDLIRNGEDVWYWDSDENLVAHQSGVEGHAGPEDMEAGAMSMLSSEAMAELALAWIEPTTEVDVDGTATVAGRAAYELVARPRDDQSLVGSVRLAVDGEHGVPLRIQVFDAEGGEPAIEVGFTSVSFSEPDPSVYEFTPPPGASVEELDAEHWLEGSPLKGHSDRQADAPGLDVDVVGEGWTSVMVVSGVKTDEISAQLEELTGEDGGQAGDLAAYFESVLGEMQPMSGAYGTGLGYQSKLFSVLWLEDGRLLLGAVGLDALEDAAS